MLEYSEPDLEEVFLQTFRVGYQDVFGSLILYDLKQNADSINVNQENKKACKFILSIYRFVY